MRACREPSIEEMLADPIVRDLMAADGIDPNELKALLRSVAECRRGSVPPRQTTNSPPLSAPLEVCSGVKSTLFTLSASAARRHEQTFAK